MKLSVAYAVGNKSFRQAFELEAPVTAEQAIHHSRLLSEFPELDLKKLKIGIFGKVCKNTQELEEGDRVEVYEPTRVVQDDDDDDDD
jgi:putative ubiquitin-RnfH superfamily antitoxin RatB of RatAB toxin-antitoxin module